MQNSTSSSLLGTISHTSHINFSIIAVALSCILATGFLLISYYIFVIKCCLNWHHNDLLRRFSFSQRQHDESRRSPVLENRGLDEAIIRSIPVLQYRKGEINNVLREEKSLYECAVCLSEFQEEEKLRVIPNCSHVFHIDCIDIWLQNNSNCPLCRTSISEQLHIMVPIFSNPISNLENYAGRDEDYVVIELGELNQPNNPLIKAQERELSAHSFSPSSRKLMSKTSQMKKKTFGLVSSMGDECICITENDEQFAIQPISRSISMDSAADPILQLAVQEILAQPNNSRS